MTYLGNEETLVELPAVNYLEKNLGYSFIYGKDLTPEMRREILYLMLF